MTKPVAGVKPEELSGPGGLLPRLAGRVVEAAVEAEMPSISVMSRGCRRARTSATG